MRKHRSIFIVILMLLTIVVINTGQIIAHQMNNTYAATIAIMTELIVLLLMILRNRFLFSAIAFGLVHWNNFNGQPGQMIPYTYVRAILMLLLAFAGA